MSTASSSATNVGQDLAPGVSAGDYLLGQQIGRTEMSSVFEAVHVPSGQAVAFKVAEPELGHRPDSLRREFEALSRISHPNIPRVLHSDLGATRPFLVFPLIAGEDLSSKLAREPRNLRESMDCLESLADAIDCIHDRGIIHQDIKPANILLAASGEPYLIDFGAARVSRADQRLGRRFSGTASYASPEQLKGLPSTAASDLYSFALVAFELLTGQLPDRNLSYDRWRMVGGHELGIATGDHAVDLKIESAFGRALEEDPTRRHECASELMAELAVAVEGTSIATTDRRPAFAIRHAAPTRRASNQAEQPRPRRPLLTAICLLGPILLATGAGVSVAAQSGGATQRMASDFASINVPSTTSTAAWKSSDFGGLKLKSASVRSAASADGGLRIATGAISADSPLAPTDNGWTAAGRQATTKSGSLRLYADEAGRMLAIGRSSSGVSLAFTCTRPQPNLGNAFVNSQCGESLGSLQLGARFPAGALRADPEPSTARLLTASSRLMFAPAINRRAPLRNQTERAAWARRARANYAKTWRVLNSKPKLIATDGDLQRLRRAVSGVSDALLSMGRAASAGNKAADTRALVALRQAEKQIKAALSSLRLRGYRG